MMLNRRSALFSVLQCLVWYVLFVNVRCKFLNMCTRWVHMLD